MARRTSRATTLLLAGLALGPLACRTPLPPAAEPFTLTPDSDFRAQAPQPWEEQQALAGVEIQQFTLANGLAVYVVEQPDVPLITLAYVNRAGELERGQPAGLATLTARLLTRDTLLADGTQVSDIQIGGVRPSASTSYSGTSVGFTIVSSGTRVAIETLGAIVQRPVFAPEKLERTKLEIGNELFDEAANLYGLGNVLTSRAVLGDEHPWSAEPKAQLKALAQVKVEDVRDFYARRYRPEQSALVVVGDVTRADVQPIIERSFGSWSVVGDAIPGTEAEAAAPDVAAAAAANTGMRTVYALLVGGPQAYIVLPQHTVPLGHPDYVALQLVSRVLGGGFTSRANQALRHDTGMSYGVQIDGVGAGSDAYLCIRSAVPNTQLREGIRRMDSVLDRLRREPVSEQELADARTDYLSDLGASLLTQQGAVNTVGNLFLSHASADDLRKLEQEIRAATPADLQRAAQRYLRANSNLVVLTNYIQYGNQLTGVGNALYFEQRERAGR